MIPAIVLAAGRSSRMGRSKPLLPIGSETFVTRIVATFLEAGIDDVVIVLGAQKDAVRNAVVASGLPARFVENDAYDTGQLSSLLAGLLVVDRPGVDAALVTLADVPLVSAATVAAVVDCYRRTHAPVVRPTRGSQHGHPLLVDRSLFSALRHADPESGAKPIVRAHATPAGDLPVADPGAFADIDTPDDYERAVTGGAAGAPGARMGQS